MNTMLFGVLALSATNFVLLLWLLMLRSKITELRAEIQKRKEWHRRSLEKDRERM